MTDRKHTPLPWECDGDRVIGLPKRKPTKSYPKFIVSQCMVYCGQGNGTIDFQEASANAEYELVEALEKLALEHRLILEHHPQYSDDFREYGCQILDDARAILARAKSGQEVG